MLRCGPWLRRGKITDRILCSLRRGRGAVISTIGRTMKNKKRYHKKLKFTYINITMLVLFGCLLYFKGYTPYKQTGDNLFHVRVNGQEVGVIGQSERAEELLSQARRNVAMGSEELLFMEAELELTGEAALWGEADDEESVLRNMEGVLRASIQPSMHRSYTVKINENILNMGSVEEVQQLLQAAIDKYDTEGKFSVKLVYDTNREFGVLTTNVVNRESETEDTDNSYLGAGIQNFFSEISGVVETEEEKDFDDYELGTLGMDFSEKIVAVETYLPKEQLTPLEDAINLIVMEQEMPSIYEVVAGDTLTAIAIKVNLPMEQIVEMNDILEDVNTTLHIGDKLLITVPEPELSVTRVEERYYEEVYDAEIKYIENPKWYTSRVEVRQQPHAGFRKVVARVTYVNDKEVSREILKEEIAMEAVPKIVERGTQVPPTYIKPLNGGKVTSTFGNRPRPTAGASTYHQAIDWGTPTGTPIYASSGGTVSRAGWIGSYGYAIYITHPDGRETRYAHLSKILVKPGQKVKQGDKIALSGNTGVTTGPHLHFEMIINGKKVDPFKNGVPR